MVPHGSSHPTATAYQLGPEEAATKVLPDSRRISL